MQLLDGVLECGLTFQAKIIGQQQFVFTADPAVVKHMLSDNFDNYIKVFVPVDILLLCYSPAPIAGSAIL